MNPAELDRLARMAGLPIPKEAPVTDPAPNFEGHPARECGEHRTVGAHRAWCHGCQEWCYPAGPCKGCELPALRAEVAALRALADAARALVAAEEKHTARATEYAAVYRALRALDALPPADGAPVAAEQARRAAGEA